MTIAELPFVEKPLLELLHLDEDRDEPSREFAGFGWARVPELWLESAGGDPVVVTDTLVLALHSADDAEPLADDVELELELPTGPVSVLLSKFLPIWLPKLPRASSIVLALCNAHGATLAKPAGVDRLWYGIGDVASWREDDDRVLLTADEWRTL